jgi:predicted transcriptional regulator
MTTTLAAQKVTITLPAELLAYASAEAERLDISRSQVIARALAAQRKRERDELAAEGYRFYNAEACEFAEASAQAVAEALGDAY